VGVGAQWGKSGSAPTKGLRGTIGAVHGETEDGKNRRMTYGERLGSLTVLNQKPRSEVVRGKPSHWAGPSAHMREFPWVERWLSYEEIGVGEGKVF